MASATASSTFGFLQHFASGASRFSRACPHPSKRGRTLLLSACAVAALACFFGGVSPASATVTWTWVGGTSTDWSTAANWDQASVPTSASSVTLDTGSGNQAAVSTASASTKNITIGSTNASSSSTKLTIQNGKTLASSGSGVIGLGSGSTGAVLVTGATTLWNVQLLTVGDAGNGNLTVSSGGTLDVQSADGNGNAVVLGNQSGSVGNVLVTGTGSVLVLDAGGLLVGSHGNGNLTLANGANLTVAAANTAGFGLTIGDQSGTSLVTMQDAGSIASLAGALMVGNLGNGTLNISNGAHVTVAGQDASNIVLYVGAQAGSTSNLTVDGANSILTFNGIGSALIGNSGNGNLTVSNGGKINMLMSDPASLVAVTVGANSGSRGNVTITGANSIWNVGTAGAGSLAIGKAGNGNLTIANGGNVNIQGADNNGFSLLLGGNGSGNVTVQNTGSQLLTIGKIAVTNGTFTVSGGVVNSSDLLLVANQSVNATFHQTGGNVTIGGLGKSAIGSGNGSTGFFNMDGGTLNFSDGLNLGSAAGTGVGNFTQTGGNVTVSGDTLEFGPFGITSGTGYYVISGGNLTAPGGVIVGSKGNGTLTISGTGVFDSGLNQSLVVGYATGGTGVVNLNGGTLRTEAIVHNGPGGATINFNSGVLQATADSTDFISSFADGNLAIQSGGALIDTNGFSDVIQSNFTGTGGLSKNGNGTLTLTGNNLYSGNTSVNKGTLILSGNNNGATGNLVLNANTVINLNGAQALPTGGFIINGGTLDNTQGSTVIISSTTPVTLNSNFTFAGSNGLNLGNGAVTLNASTIQITSLGHTLGLGNIGDGGNGFGLTVTGAGKVALNGATNTYTGLTTIQNGELILGGNLASNLTMNGAATLTLKSGLTESISNVTLNSGNIIGGGNLSPSSITTNNSGSSTISANVTGVTGLNVNGTGTLNLTGNNSFSGDTNVNSGTLVVSGNNATSGNINLNSANLSLNSNGSLGNSPLNINGGNLDNTGPSAVVISTGVPVSLNADFTFVGTKDLNLGTGTVIFNNQLNITVVAGNLAFGGHIDDETGGLTLEKYGNGSLVLRSAGSALGGGAANIYQGSLVLAGSSNSLPTYVLVNLGDGNSGSATLVLGDANSGGVSQIIEGLNTSGTGTQNAVIGGNSSTSTLILNVPGPSDVNEFDGYLGVGAGNVSAVPANALALTKIGAGTLILTADNTYLGGTSIEGGTIQISNATNIGADTGNVLQGVVLGNGSTSAVLEITTGGQDTNSFTTNRYITLNGTNAAVQVDDGVTLTLGATSGIQSNGSTYTFNKTGNGTLILAGNAANYSYNSGTNIAAGLLQLAAADLVNSASAVTVASGATFDLNGYHDAIGSLAGSGNVTLGAGGHLVTGGDNTSTTFSGLISDAGSLATSGNLVKTGTGNFKLASANTFTGNTTVLGGTLTLASNLALQNSTLSNFATVLFGPGITNVTLGGLSGSSNIALNNTGSGAVALTVGTNGANTTYSGNLTSNGSVVKVGGGNLIFAGTNSYTGTTSVNGGTLTFAGDTSAYNGTTITNNANLAFAQSFSSTFTGNITGNGNFTQAGSATLTLTGNNTFSGNTSVTGGTLVLTRAFALGNSTEQDLFVTGGNLISANTILGNTATGNGSALVSGLGHAWNVNGDLVVGNLGYGNLTVNDGGNSTVTGNLTIGEGAGSLGEVFVDGANSFLTAFYGVVGESGNGNLTVSNGALFDTTGNVGASGLVIGDQAGSFGNVVVQNSGSRLLVNGSAVVVGNLGSGYFSVSDGAYANLTGSNAANISLYLGLGANSTGTANISAATLDVGVSSGPGAVVLGGANGSSGTLNILNSGSVNINGKDANGVAAYVGYAANSTGNVLVDDGSGLLSLGGGALVVGYNGTGNVTVDSAATLDNETSDTHGVSAYVGYNAGATGNVTVTNSGSQWFIDGGSLMIGYNGTGNVTISNGASLSALSTYLGYNALSNGTLNVQDADSSYAVNTGALRVGYNGTGSLNVSNGGIVNLYGGVGGVSLYVGGFANGTGNVDITGSGSSVSANHSVVVGNYGNGKVTVEDSGLFTINGSLILGQHITGYGEVHLSTGGTLQIGGANGILAGTGDYDFFMAGGEIQVINSDLTSSVDISMVSPNIDVIDTNGFNATLSGNLSGEGTLRKIGDGNLTLLGNNTYTGDTTVSGGTLFLDGFGEAGNITATNSLIVGQYSGDSATLQLVNGSSLTANYGTIGAAAHSHGYMTVDNSSALFTNSLYVGDSGHGHLTIQNGGSVEIAGADSNGFGLSVANNGRHSYGNVTITDAGSSLTIDDSAGALSVGTSGRGKLNVFGGAALTTSGTVNDLAVGGNVAAYIGYNGQSNGTINISDPQLSNSTWNINNGAAIVGYTGHGALNVTNNGIVNLEGSTSTGYALIAGFNASSIGNITVSDPGSALYIDGGTAVIGNNGTGSLTISNGGFVDSTAAGVGSVAAFIGAGAGNGTVTVQDCGSLWNIGGGILVIGVNGNGTLNILNHGVVNSTMADSQNDVYLGMEAGSTGNALVSGHGSTWNISSGGLAVGYNGTGNLVIQSNGTVNSMGANGAGVAAYLGQNGTGTVTVQDYGQWNVSGGAINVGHGGEGDLYVYSGGNVTISGSDTGDSSGVSLYVGVNSAPTVTSSVLVQDLHSSLTTNGTVVVGSNAAGNFSVSNGGYVEIDGVDNNSIGAYVGQGGNGSLTISDIELGSNTTSQFLVANGAFVVGYTDGGNGTVTVSNGGYLHTTGVDQNNNVGAYIGYNGAGNGTVTITGVEASTGTRSMWDNSFALSIGQQDNTIGALTISNGGAVTTYGKDLNFVGAYVGQGGNSIANLTVTGVAVDNSNNTYQSYFDVKSGALAVGFTDSSTGTANVANGGLVIADGIDSNRVGMYIGFNSNSNGTVTVSDVSSLLLSAQNVYFQSELDVNKGALVIASADSSNGTLTISNGGLVNASSSDTSGIGLYIGQNGNATGNVTVTGVEQNSGFVSQLNITGGALALGYNDFSNGILTVSNGGNVSVSGSDANGIAVYLGYGANATGTLLVTDAASVQSGLTISNGALVVGYNGLGNLTVANGAYVHAYSSDANGIAVYLGYAANSTGNITVKDPGVQSNMFVDGGALAVGYNGAGNLTIANGAYVNARSTDINGYGMYLAYGANSTGNLTITDAYTDDQSRLNVTRGAVIAGYNGNATINIMNGGYMNISSADDSGVSLYVGYANTSTSTITINGTESITSYSSELDVYGGAMDVGFYGNGTVNVSNGGYLYMDTSDNRGISLYLGRHSGSSGNLSLDSGADAEMYGALAVGYRGVGNLSITNGSTLYIYDNSNNGQGMVVGWHGSASGSTASISDLGSMLKVNSGALTVGNWGQGSLTIANGAQVIARDYDNNGIGMYLGRGANGIGNVTVQDVYEFDGAGNLDASVLAASALTINSGALAVGYSGVGVLTVANGGQVTAAGTDNIDSGLYVGYNNGSTGTVTVDGVRISVNSSVFDDTRSTFSITNDAGIIGHSGTGTFTVSNGALATFGSTDSNSVGLYIGNNSDGSGTVNVDGGYAPLINPTIAHPSVVQFISSELDVTSGALVVGASGTGVLNVTNGGYANISGLDASNIGLYLGANGSSTGTVNVDGVAVVTNIPNVVQPAGFPFGTFRSKLDVNGGATIVGGNGYGNLNITNGGVVNLSGNDGNGNGLFIGQGGDGSGDVNVDGVFIDLIPHGPFIRESSNLNVSGGAAFIGYSGSGNLTISNGGSAFLSGNDANLVAAYLGYNSGVVGNLTVTGYSNANLPGIVPAASRFNSYLEVDNGALDIGFHGTGNLYVSNSGFVSLDGADNQGVGLYLGRHSSASGYLTVTDPNSELDVTNGATVIGYRGFGSLTIANGGFMDSYGMDAGNIAAYVGWHGSSSANVSIADSNSQWLVESGALIAGNRTEGDIYVSNGGLLNVTGNNGNGIGAILGYHGSGSGYITVQDDGSAANFTSTLIAGRWGEGYVSVSNGGAVNLNGNDSAGVAAYFGYQSAGFGNLSVDGVNSNSGNSSIVTVTNGALVFGFNGTGNLTVSNGGTLNVRGTDGNVGVHFGYNSGSNGTGMVTDTNSALNVTNGSVVIGNSGTGNLSIANGAVANFTGFDLGNTSLVLGNAASGAGTLSVDGAAVLNVGDGNNSGFGSVVIGYNGTGNVSVTNGGVVNQNGYDGSNASLILGLGNNAIGTLAIDGTGSAFNVVGGYNSGYATVIGYNGTGNLSLTNNATFFSNGWDGELSLSMYLGYNASALGSVSVDNSTLTLNGTVGPEGEVGGGLAVGFNGMGNVSVTNGGVFTVYNKDDNGFTVTLGYNSGANGNVTVDGEGSALIIAQQPIPQGLVPAKPSNPYGLLVVGEAGSGALTISNGGVVTAPGGVLLADKIGSTGNISIVTGGTLEAGGSISAGAGSYQFFIAGSTLRVVGSDLLGSIDILTSSASLTDIIDTNGFNATLSGNISGTDALQKINDGTLTLNGTNTYAGGTIIRSGSLVVDNGSIYHPDSDLLVVQHAYDNATLTIQNGGNVTAGNMYVGTHYRSNGTVTVDGNTSLLTLNGTLAMGGYRSQSSLTIQNGGAMVINNSADGLDIAALINAEGTGSHAELTVTGTDGNSTAQSSSLTVNYGAMVVGNDDRGHLAITNGGYVQLNGTESNYGAGLILGNNSGSSGHLYISGVNNNSDSPVAATLNVTNGSMVVGADGSGHVYVSNGGAINVSGNDSNSLALVLGYNTGSTGRMTLSGVESVSGLSSTLTAANGGAVVGYDGNGTLNLYNGALANITGNDGNGLALSIGLNSDATGTVNVSDVFLGDTSNISSTLQVSNNALAVGVNGNGTLAIANGGYVNAAGIGVSGHGLVIGSNFGSNGTVTVDGVESTSGIASELDVTAGILMVGDYGNGTLSITNGGQVYASGNNSYSHGLEIAYGKAATGSVTVDGVDFNSGTQSYLEVSGGSLVVGGYGAASLTVSNGGYVYSSFADSHGIALYLGKESIASGTANITGFDSNLNDSSELDVANGALAIGYHGIGNLNVTNGGYVDAYGKDSHGVSVYLGRHGDGSGNVTVDDAEFDVGNGSLAVGFWGNGNLTVQNGGFLDTYGADSNNVTAFIGYHGPSTGSVTVTDLASEWLVESGQLAVGYNGTGNLTIQNGGNVTVTGADGNNVSVMLGALSSVANGTITVDGNGSVLNIGPTFGTSIVPAGEFIGGLLVVGENGTGTLNISNGGLVNALGGVLLADQSGSTGNVNITNGGTLATGGAFGLTYGDGSYQFFMAGGTLQVIGRDLTSDIDILTSSAGLTDIIDTNGFNATLFGNISGNDVIQKISQGTLTLTGNNTYSGGTIVSNGTLVLNGGSITHSSGDLIVGQLSGDNGTFNLVNGGNATANNVIIGQHHDAFGSVMVDASVLNAQGYVTVGDRGHGNLTIQNLGQVNVNSSDANDYSLIIGEDHHSHGDVTVTGSDGTGNYSALYLSDALAVGGNGHGNLTISNGGLVSTGDTDNYGYSLDVGVSAHGRGSVTITDANSTLSLDGSATIGNNGQGLLTIQNGGSLLLGGGIDIGLNPTGNGTVSVSDNNTVLIMGNGLLTVGDNGTGALNIVNGGAVSSNATDGYNITAYLGLEAGSNGTVSVSGNGSTWTLAGGVFVGASGNGTLAVANGGNVTIEKTDNFTRGLLAGVYSGATGAVTVDGNNSLLDVKLGSVILGWADGANGSLSITNGGTIKIEGSDGAVGLYDGLLGNGTVIVDGNLSQLTVSGGNTVIGYTENGSLTITNGGQVFLESGASGTSLILGQTSTGYGNLSMNGSASRLSANGTVYATNGAVDIEAGHFNITNGGLVLADGASNVTFTQGGGIVKVANDVTVGTGANVTGTYLLSAGKLVTDGALLLGGVNSTGVFTQSGGSFYSHGSGNISVGNGGTGVLNVNGGYFDTNANSLVVTTDGNSTGTVNLNGGTLATAQVINGGEANSSIAALNFNGGVLQATGNNSNFLANFDDGQAVLLAGGAFLDSNGYNITISTNLAGVGALTKQGDGYLTLSGNNAYANGTTVTAGFINFGNNSNLGSGNIYLQNGGLQWATETSTDISSRLILNDGLDTLDTNGNDVTFASGIHGLGSLAKIGNGTLTLGGANDYTGDTYIGAGNVVVGAGASLTGSSNIFVGSAAAGNLTIANGGNVSTADAVIGSNNTGTVTVTGNGSVFSASDELDIGTNGNNGTLTVTSNATATFGFLELGENGTSTATLNIGNGAVVSVGALYLANTFGTTGNVNINPGGTLAIDGDGGITTGLGNYSFSIDGGTLKVFDVGLTTGIDMILAGGNIATINTNGLDSILNGVLSGSGILNKVGTGNLTLTNAETYSGGTNVLAGALIVDGGSIDHPGADLYVGGNANETAAFVAQNNATITVAEFSMANTATANDTATINNSTLNVEDGALIVGVNGTAALTANNGSTINLDSSGSHGVSLYVGENAGANGTVTITDSGTVLNSNGSIIVGFDGTGHFTLANGGVVNVNAADQASNGFVVGVTGTGVANITGVSSNLTVNDGALAVGFLNDGTMNVSDGAKVKTYGINNSGATIVLGFGANGSLNVTNATLSTHNGSIVVGDAGNGTLTVDVGSVFSHGSDGNNSLILGNLADSSGNVFIGINGDGAHYNSFTGALVVGNEGSGSLVVDANAFLKSYGTDSLNNALLIGNGANSTGSVDVLGYLGIRSGNVTVGNLGNGTLTVDNGGYASISSGNVILLASDANATATVNVNSGGTLSVGGVNGIQAGNGGYAFNLNGGTVRVHGSDLTTSVNFALGNNTTSSINTNGYNATINGTLSGQGGIAKDGNGTLTLNANNNFTGATNVNTGNLVVNGQYASSVVVNGSNSILGGNGTINGNVALSNGAAVAPGIANGVSANIASGLANLTVTGNLVWNVTATILPWHLSVTNSSSDLLGVVGNVTNPGNLDTIIFDFQNTGFFDGVTPTTYTLITSANDMSNAGFNLSQFQAMNVAGSVFDATNQSHFLFANGGTALEFVVVPEPSTWGLLAGGAMLMMALRRKRNVVKA